MNQSAPRIAQVYGFWAQNIGNAFFNIGGNWVLRQVFGAENVGLIRDQPGYRTFHKQHMGNPHNDVNLLNMIDADYVVLQGPMMTRHFRALWEPAFKIYREKGIKVILLGAAFFKYDSEEQEAVREFLTEYPPAIISTRDHISYGIVRDWIEWTHNGIDSAFFVDDAYHPIRLDPGPYIALNFDRFPEPTIEVEGLNGADVASRGAADAEFDWNQKRWSLRVPLLQKRLSAAGKAIAYLGHLVDLRRLPDQVDGYSVIRPEHRYTPHMTWKIYKNPNAMTSDEPHSFLSVYANAELTLADRVHACVATLAYGKPAMLFTPSPRQALFGRLGLDAIRHMPVLLDPEYLKQQKDEQLAFLKSAVAAQG